MSWASGIMLDVGDGIARARRRLWSSDPARQPAAGARGERRQPSRAGAAFISAAMSASAAQHPTFPRRRGRWSNSACSTWRSKSKRVPRIFRSSVEEALLRPAAAPFLATTRNGKICSRCRGDVHAHKLEHDSPVHTNRTHLPELKHCGGPQRERELESHRLCDRARSRGICHR